MSIQSIIKGVGKLRPLHNTVFVSDLESGPRLTRGGVIIPDDNMKDSGIRDRWGKVWAIGPDVVDIEPGEWVLVKHGRWTQGIEIDTDEGILKVWKVEYPDSTLLASREPPAARKINL